MLKVIDENKVVAAIIKISYELKNLMLDKKGTDEGAFINNILEQAETFFAFIKPDHNNPDIKKMKSELLAVIPIMNSGLAIDEKEKIKKIIKSIP